MSNPKENSLEDSTEDRRALRRSSTLKRAVAERSGQRLFMSWIEQDIENRFGFFRGGRYTAVNTTFSMIIGVLLTVLFYALLTFARGTFPALDGLTKPFLRSANLWTVVPGMFFFFWGLTTLIIKNSKIDFQRRTLLLTAVPQQPEFVLTEATARPVLERLHCLVDHPRHFLLLNRIERALASLHNIGSVSDVSSILKTQAENDENQMVSSYTLVNGFIWATPVLGFIGTVLGLSQAIGQFAGVLNAKKESLDAVTNGLKDVTGGLSTAFETTLVALVCALLMQLYVNYLQHRESDFLDECNDYCHAHLIAKLRLIRRDAVPPSAE